MCGRFTTLTYEEVLRVIESIASPESEDLASMHAAFADGPQVDATASGQALVITDTPSGLQPTQATWGFRLREGGQLAINARIESARKPQSMWGPTFDQGRCVVPARRFFEPHISETAISPKTGKPARRQYCFEPVARPYLLMAAVISEGRFAIVTTSPTPEVAPIHPRMPLLLEPEDVPLWLFGGRDCLDLPFGTRLAIEPEHPEENYQAALF